jgi:hypothetical protein
VIATATTGWRGCACCCLGVLPRSDGVGEFVEDRCERVLSVEIHAEFVVATAKI